MRLTFNLLQEKWKNLVSGIYILCYFDDFHMVFIFPDFISIVPFAHEVSEPDCK